MNWMTYLLRRELDQRRQVSYLERFLPPRVVRRPPPTIPRAPRQQPIMQQ